MFPLTSVLNTLCFPGSMTTLLTPYFWTYTCLTDASAPQPPNSEFQMFKLETAATILTPFPLKSGSHNWTSPIWSQATLMFTTPQPTPQVFSYCEELASAPFHDLASDLGFRLLNTQGVYTRFPLSGSQRPGVIDLAFTNPQMSSTFLAWDALTLPPMGSDHVSILITLASPTETPLPKTPCWDSTDCEVLHPRLDVFCTPPAPPRPSPAQLEEWFLTSLNCLTALIINVTLLSRLSPRSKPWWTPLLTTLHKEYQRPCAS